MKKIIFLDKGNEAFGMKYDTITVSNFKTEDNDSFGCILIRDFEINENFRKLEELHKLGKKVQIQSENLTISDCAVKNLRSSDDGKNLFIDFNY